MSYREYMTRNGNITHRNHQGKRYPTDTETINTKPNSFTDMVRELISLIGESAYNAWDVNLPNAVRYDRAEMTLALQTKINKETAQ